MPALQLLQLEARDVPSSLAITYSKDTKIVTIHGSEYEDYGTINSDGLQVHVLLRYRPPGPDMPLVVAAERTFAVGAVKIVQFLGKGNSDNFDNNSTFAAKAIGGSGNDHLVGGRGRDTLLGGLGVDSLVGNGGDDLIAGNLLPLGAASVSVAHSPGAGNDTINGGSGNDRLYGAGENESIFGGDGNDTISGFQGNDYIDAGAGDDRVNGHAGRDTIYGDSGHDYLSGHDDRDSVYGGDGNDNIYGGGDRDHLQGDDDQDTLVGGSGSDSMTGGYGVDHLFGESGNDTVRGGPHADSLDGGTGNDEMHGDAAFGSEGDDSMVGGDGYDTLYGGGGNDAMNGGKNNDTLYGGSGADSLNGWSGHDRLHGDGDDDLLEGYSGFDTLYGSIGNDTLSGGADDDKLFGNENLDTLAGGSGNDWLEAGSAAEAASGDDGYDINAHRWAIDGASASDIFQGSIGNCVFVSSLSAAANAGIDLADRIEYLGNYEYRVKLYDPETLLLKNFTVTFDGRYDVAGLPLYVWYDPKYKFVDPYPGAQGEFWTLLYHRAYMKLVNNIDENFKDPYIAMPALTGREAFDFDEDVLLPSVLKNYLDSDKIITAGQADDTNLIVSSHSYSVIDVWNASGTWMIKIRNPWGKDARAGMDTDGPNDGYITMSWDDFVDEHDFDRVTVS